MQAFLNLADKVSMTWWIVLGLGLFGAVVCWYKVLIPIGRMLELQEELMELQEQAAGPSEEMSPQLARLAESVANADAVQVAHVQRSNP